MTYRLPALNTLRAFEAAARHSSFKTAAGELGVTAGAVSQQVKKLEASLGVTLFRRLTHGLLLTIEGETYLPLITKVFDDLTRATELIAPDINAKKFTVGICASVKAMMPAAWPKQSDALHRHVRDWIETSDVELLRDNELDCLIRSGGGPYRGLALVVVPVSSSARDVHFVCQPGLADCTQSKVIIQDLTWHLNQPPAS